MKHYLSLEEVSLQGAWLTIGVFDGVHRGHRTILEKLTAGARAQNAPAVLLTFAPHPAEVLTGREIKCLTTPQERAILLGELGVDVVITQTFTRELAAVLARDYVMKLQRSLAPRHLLIGYDFALGRGREGDSTRLTQLGGEFGFEVEVIPALGDESGVISSTAIRRLIASGNVSAAANLLGYPYTLSGQVIHGDGRGKKINVPTANVDYLKHKAVPANGIYACWAHLDGRRYRAAVNIGFNPTFTPERKTPSLEAHLLDFDGEIYGRALRLDFVTRLRDELKFNSVDELLSRIWDDIHRTRETLR